jgi:prepilin-type N-terminal cleavage/methylation domain-containing protein
MATRGTKFKKGFTLVELMMTALISSIIVLGIGILLADSLRGWRVMYERLHSPEADNTYAVRRMFDRVIRQAISQNAEVTITDAGDSVTAYYYNSKYSIYADREVKLTWTSNDKILTLTCSIVNPDKTTTKFSEEKIKNVSYCFFKSSNPPPARTHSIQMLLTIDNTVENNTQILNICSTAYLNPM